MLAQVALSQTVHANPDSGFRMRYQSRGRWGRAARVNAWAGPLHLYTDGMMPGRWVRTAWSLIERLFVDGQWDLQDRPVFLELFQLPSR
jgi:hypothetical protein